MMVLVTGGSGSGKSSYAEAEILKLGPKRRFYLATMKPWDEECRCRIERHRAMRAGRRFETVECYRELGRLILPSGTAENAVLLECVSNLVSNELFGTDENDFPDRFFAEYGRMVADKVVAGVQRLKSKAADIIIVTNEVFSDGDFNGRGEAAAFYLKVLGEVNCRLAANADRVVEVTVGIPFVLKG